MFPMFVAKNVSYVIVINFLLMKLFSSSCYTNFILWVEGYVSNKCMQTNSN